MLKTSKFIYNRIIPALSLFVIIDDLEWINIYENLQKWILYYRILIEKMGRFLFGWVDFWGVKFTDTDYHTLVLAKIAIVAFSKSMNQQATLRGEEKIGQYSLIPILLLVLLLLLFLPSPWDIGVVGLASASTIIGTFMPPEKNDSERDIELNKIMRKELLAIFGILLFLVLLNYVIFSKI